MMACQVCTSPWACHESWDIQAELPPFPDISGLGEQLPLKNQAFWPREGIGPPTHFNTTF